MRIAGVGSFLPDRRVTSTELEDVMKLPAGWVERATGVRERRRATHETTAGMAADAARRALAMAGMEPSDLDAIVFASAAPQQAIPCTAAFVQRALGAPDGGSACWDVNATCLSFLFALHNLAPLVAGGAYRAVLLVSSEILTHSLNPAERESATLFGDAAAAAVLVRSDGDGEIRAARFVTYSSAAELTEVRGAGTRHHPNDPGTHPEMNTFRMNGRAIYRRTFPLIVPFLHRVVDEAGWSVPEVDWLVPHQASGHALTETAERAGFPPERVIVNLPERGNCVAASIPLALAEGVEDGRIRRGNRLLLAGTGAGLTLGAVALTF
ncbi:MAG TPA: beta-ketoacyl-ACP synthase 3 [Longimicrobium sp.]|nr:beta-ketoacyl-ACP synthase 3 [Longimicrobium sp.]